MYNTGMSETRELSIQALNDKFPAAVEYLKEIFLVNRDYGLVKNSVIARRLDVSKPAVTQAMKRLKKFGLIEQDLYGSICLTAAGRSIAARVLKRHYLIEHLLILKLDYPWVKSDEEAGRIQSTLSDEFTEYLYEKLGKPETCPHGNPFPGSGLEEDVLAAPRLDKAEENCSVRIVRITEEGEAVDGLLQFCYENNIRPGAEFSIDSLQDDGVYVSLGGDRIFIPSCFAEYICFTGI